MVTTSPLINFCHSRTRLSFIDQSFSFDRFNFNLNKEQLEYSPRFIHYHEISIFYQLMYLHGKMSKSEEKQFLENREKFILSKYTKFNGTNDNSHYPVLKKCEKQDQCSKHIVGRSEKTLDKLQVGLVNIIVDEKDSIESFLGHPNLSFHRMFNIFEVLNLAAKNGCHIVVLPEISIPFHWLKLIADFSKLHGIAVVFGLEHFSVKTSTETLVYNYSIAILPFKDGLYSNAFIHFNLKQHYSPEEIAIIKGHRYAIPSKYFDVDIYSWHGILFSIFNCFEMADIELRSKLIGQNDFIVAVEYNKDTNYFSNIVESVVRDIHAYVIQVNTAKYGDSRITQPTKSVTMDILKIKGGKNVTLLVDEIDIKSLRAFQRQSWNAQKTDGSFKLTPPNFGEKSSSERTSP